MDKEIKAWAKERGLLDTDPNKQFIKLIEETGELADSLLKGNLNEQKDAIGDIIVVLIILAEQLGTNITECLDIAWNEIKDRKGKTINGVFIKELEK